MGEETRERTVAICTKAAMMMEDLTAKALEAPELSTERLNGLLNKMKRDLLAILDLLQKC